MQKQLSQIFIVLLGALLFVSCGKIKRPGKASATGRAGELLVVVDKANWEGASGAAIRDVFQQNVPMFLQPEPMFDLVQIEPERFVRLFETHRHIFIADIAAEHPRATLEVTRDVWAYPQMVIRVKAPDDSTFRVVMQRNADAFLEHYLAAERERLINAYMRMTNLAARNAVKRVFNVDMVVPDGYYVAVEGDQFIWLRRTGTRDDFDLGVMIAALPYKDPAVDFDPGTIRARRDSLTRKYIPGQFDGSYMTTYPELQPETREINFNGIFAVESRSLWRVEGDFMGGPYVSYTMVDEHTNRLMVFDGFVYAPNFDKRDYLRQVMAVIFSTEFVRPVQ